MKLIKRNFLLDGGSILLETDNGYYLFNECFSDSEFEKNKWFSSNKNVEKVELIEDENLILNLNLLRDTIQATSSSRLINNTIDESNLEPVSHTNPRKVGNCESAAFEILKTTFENPRKLKVSWTL